MVDLMRKPTHPGEILLEEFLEPMELTQLELARRMGVSVQRVNTLINGKRDMTAETKPASSEARKMELGRYAFIPRSSEMRA